MQNQQKPADRARDDSLPNDDGAAHKPDPDAMAREDLPEDERIEQQNDLA